MGALALASSRRKRCHLFSAWAALCLFFKVTISGGDTSRNSAAPYQLPLACWEVGRENPSLGTWRESPGRAWREVPRDALHDEREEEARWEEREGESPEASEAPGTGHPQVRDHAALESCGTGGPRPARPALMSVGAPELVGLGLGGRTKAKKKKGVGARSQLWKNALSSSYMGPRSW